MRLCSVSNVVDAFIIIKSLQGGYLRAVFGACQYRRHFILLTLMLFCAPLLQAKVLVVISRDTAAYRDVTAAMASYAGTPFQVETIESLRKWPSLLSPRTDITVAVGAVATEYLLDRLPPRRRLLATFISETAWRTLLAQYETRWRRKRDTLSVLYLDQPIERQLALARLVMPAATHIGAVTGLQGPRHVDALNAAAERFNFTLNHRTLDGSEHPVRQLQPLIQQSDLFVPLADDGVFNRTTAKWILYIAYRHRVPLIGFSRKYVDAGAVAAVYSSAEQLGRQAGEFLARYNSTAGPLPPAQYPRYYSVITNRSAARSLQLSLLSDPVLSERLAEMLK